jgi:hypothetical protein
MAFRRLCEHVPKETIAKCVEMVYSKPPGEPRSDASSPQLRPEKPLLTDRLSPMVIKVVNEGWSAEFESGSRKWGR